MTADLDDVCFVIGRPRSGTTVFRNMLETNPALFDTGEIFNESTPDSYFHFLQRRQAQDATALFPGKSVENFVAYVRWCRSKSLEKQPQSRRVVLDVKYDQAHLLTVPWWGITFLPRIFLLMREQNWRVIDIRRRDILGMHISNEVAIATKIYHSTGLAEGQTLRANVRIDPDAVVRYVRATAQAYKRVGDHFAGYDRYIEVTYEEMFEGADGAFSSALLARLSSFLGVENRFDPVPRLAKLLVDDPYVYVENADEIRDTVLRNKLMPPP